MYALGKSKNFRECMTGNYQQGKKTFSSFQTVIMAVMAYSLFAFADAMEKWLQAEGFDRHFILFLTQLPGFIVLLSYMLTRYGWSETFKKERFKWHVARAISLVSLTYFLFLAVAELPLANLYGIIFCSPFITAFGAWLFFKERQHMQDWIAIAIGFIGIIFIAKPDYSGFNIGYIFAFFQALSISAASLFVRKIGPSENPFVFVIYANAAIMIANIVPAASTTLPEVTGHHILVFISYAMILPLGILCLSTSFTHTPRISIVLPFIYIQILWGTIIGYLVFNDVLTWNVAVGAGIIIICGLYLIFHQRSSARRR